MFGVFLGIVFLRRALAKQNTNLGRDLSSRPFVDDGDRDAVSSGGRS